MKQNLFILIGLNVLVFLLQLGDENLTMQLALWPPHNDAYFQPWQWFTHLFAHHSWLHLFLNMWAIWTFAPLLWHAYGTQKFVKLYLGSALFAALIPVAWNAVLYYGLGQTHVAWTHYLGASGAVFGLLGAIMVRFPNLPMRLLFFPKYFSARSLILGLCAYECFAQITGFSLFGAGIGHLAHLSGAVAGFGLAKWYDKY